MTNTFGDFCYLLSFLHDLRHRKSVVFLGSAIAPLVDICRYFTGRYVLYRRWTHNELLVRLMDGKWRWESVE